VVRLNLEALKSLKEYVVLDIETTGLDPEQDDIIELSFLHIRKRTIVYAFDSFARLDLKKENTAKYVNGIEEEQLANAPHIKDVLAFFYGYTALRGIPNYVGHNIAFDIQFLRQKFERYLGRDGRLHMAHFFCTMRMATDIYELEKWPTLEELAGGLGIEADGPLHISKNDVLVTYKAFRILRKELLRKYRKSSQRVIYIK